MKHKINYKPILTILIDAAIIFFVVAAFQKLNIKDALFNGANSFAPAVLGIFFYTVSLFLRAGVFTKRLDPEMTILEALNIIVIGNCANLILPFRSASMLVRGRLYPQRYKDMSGRKKYITFSLALSDTICIFITAALAILFGGFTRSEFKLRLTLVLTAAVIVIAVLIVAVGFITSLKDYIKLFINLDLLYITIINLLSRFMVYLSVCTALFSIESDVVRILSWALIITVTSNLTMLIPLSPGAIGIFEYSVVYALLQTGTSGALGMAAAVLIHVIQYLAQIPLGIFLYSYKEIAKKR